MVETAPHHPARSAVPRALSAFARRADAILRAQPSAAADAAHRPTLRALFGLLFVSGLFYGAVMGCYAGVTEGRALQLLYSGLKVPMLLLVTFAISLPNFWVLNTLLGVGADFAQALRALVATQAGLTIVLASLAPFTAFWYVSFQDYRNAIVFNAAMFAVASVSAQFLLRRYYRPLIERNRTHRQLLRIWLVIYAFIGIQMGWLLRPFIGDPTQPVQFFRSDLWGSVNAYEYVAKLLFRAVRGML